MRSRPRGIAVVSKAESDRWPQMWQVWICTDPRDESESGVNRAAWAFQVPTREDADYAKRAINARYASLLVSIRQLDGIDRMLR